MWIGDFVRCHSVVRLLRERYPEPAGRRADHDAVRAAARLHAGRAQGHRLGSAAQAAGARASTRALAERLRAERYGSALVMPRTWKSALAPYLAGIPERTGFAGEARFGLLNDLRLGERKLPRMIDRCGALALPKRRGPARPTGRCPNWTCRRPKPREWRAQARPAGRRPAGRRVRARRGRTEQALAGRVFRRACAKSLTAEGHPVWVLGSPDESPLAAEIVRAAGTRRARPHLERSAQRHPGAEARAAPRCRTIPAWCMWPPRSARRPSAFSARPARGTGRRSIRSPPPSRR